MANTPEHRADVSALGRSRKDAGLRVWQYRVNIDDIWQHAKTLESDELGRRLAQRIRASAWFKAEGDGILSEYIDELDDVEDTDHFNAVWDAVCDIASYDRAWISTAVDAADTKPGGPDAEPR
ncbi:hypothetical protein AB0A73_21915 [Glycomyces sp. NPDC047369]